MFIELSFICAIYFRGFISSLRHYFIEPLRCLWTSFHYAQLSVRYPSVWLHYLAAVFRCPFRLSIIITSLVFAGYYILCHYYYYLVQLAIISSLLLSAFSLFSFVRYYYYWFISLLPGCLSIRFSPLFSSVIILRSFELHAFLQYSVSCFFAVIIVVRLPYILTRRHFLYSALLRS